jgi:hypothetical protein
MVCICAIGSNKTLCGGKVTDFVGYFTGKVDCVKCLIRQDAMFDRGYQQTVYSICYNVHQYKARKVGDYNVRIWFKKATYIQSFTAWDATTVRGAIKLGKLGVHGMGLAK